MRGGVGPATPIATRHGPVRANWLCPGDALLTRDGGYMPLVTIRRGQLAAITLPAGALGLAGPDEPLTLAACQAVLVHHPSLVRHFGTTEALSLARGLMPAAATAAQGLVDIILPEDALILAGGLWIEAHGAVASRRSLRPRLRPAILARLNAA